MESDQITIDHTLHKFVTKVVGSNVMEGTSELLAPRQLRYKVKNGAKAAVHTDRLFLQKIGLSELVLKLA